MKTSVLIKFLATLNVIAMLEFVFVAGIGGPALIVTGHHRNAVGPANILAAGLVIKLLKELGKKEPHGIDIPPPPPPIHHHPAFHMGPQFYGGVLPLHPPHPPHWGGGGGGGGGGGDGGGNGVSYSGPSISHSGHGGPEEPHPGHNYQMHEKRANNKQVVKQNLYKKIKPRNP